MNRQELFDKAVTGILKQGGPSAEFVAQHDLHGGKYPVSQCKYRGPNGMRCAIGFLIEDVSLLQEGQSLFGILADRENGHALQLDLPLAKALGIKTEDDAEFLIALQKAHDNNVGPPGNPTFLGHFRSSARMVAIQYNLNEAVLA